MRIEPMEVRSEAKLLQRLLFKVRRELLFHSFLEPALPHTRISAQTLQVMAYDRIEQLLPLGWLESLKESSGLPLSVHL